MPMGIGMGLSLVLGGFVGDPSLTLDYDFLLEMLREVEVGVIEDGTAIGTALAMAVNRLKDTEAKSKVIILLTDGQNSRGESQRHYAHRPGDLGTTETLEQAAAGAVRNSRRQG